MDVHTHTVATYTERFAIMFWKGKNSSKGLNFNKLKSEEKTTKGTHHVASFEGDDEKA